MTIVTYNAKAESNGIHNKLPETGIRGSYSTGCRTDVDVIIEENEDFHILTKLLDCKEIFKGLKVELNLKDIKQIDLDKERGFDFELDIELLAKVSSLVHSIKIDNLKKINLKRRSEEPLEFDSILSLDDCTFDNDIDFRNVSFNKNLIMFQTESEGNLLFNSTNPDKKTQIKEDLLLSSIKSQNLNLSSIECIGEFTAIDLTIHNVANVNNSKFGSALYIINSEFHKHADYSCSTFNGDFSVIETEFKNGVRFNDKASFEGNVVFNEVKFEGDTSFKEIEFKKNVSFDNTIFSKKIIFEKVNVKDKLEAKSSIFKEDFEFKTIRIGSELIFKNINFEKKFKFENYEIDYPCEFKDNEFKGITSFMNNTFEEPVSFNDSTFHTISSLGSNDYYDLFIGSHFKKVVSFNNVIFKAPIDFSETLFYAPAYFEETLFEDKTIWSKPDEAKTAINSSITFKGAIFEKESFFEDISFRKKVSFENTTFKKKVLFSKSSFRDKVHFENTSFDSFVYFGGVNFHKANIFWRVSFLDIASFEDSIFQKNVRFITNKYDPIKSLLVFRRTDFKEAFDFSYDNFRGQQIFYDVKKPKKKTLFELLDNTPEKEAGNDKITYARFRSTCCIIKDIYAKSNNKLDRFDFHKLEMSAYRKEKNKDKILLFFNYVSNVHGTSWPIGLLFTFITGSIFFILHNLLTFTGSFDFFCWASWGETTSAFLNFINPLRGLNDPVWKIESPSNWGNVIDFLAKIIVGYGIYQMIQAFRKFGKN